MSTTSTTGGAPPPALIAVDRAISELRRGLDVVVDSAAGALRVGAAEYAVPETLARRLDRAAAPRLALTARRAARLKLRPLMGDPVILPLDPGLDAAIIASLADPTSDLDNPLRGPFAVDRRPPLDAERAAIRLLKYARLLPAALIEAAGDEDGLLRVSAGAIDAYETQAATRLRLVTQARVPLADAKDTRILAFRPPDGGIEHLAIVVGDPPRDRPVLARLHSECFTGDLLGSLRCDCGEQLRGAIRALGAAGGGVVLYLAQEGRGIGLVSKLKAYRLQDQGFDTVEANERLGFEPDERIFLAAAEMLKQMGFSAVRLMTNNPAKIGALEQYGIEVVERVPHAFAANEHNAAYLETKRTRSGHLL